MVQDADIHAISHRQRRLHSEIVTHAKVIIYIPMVYELFVLFTIDALEKSTCAFYHRQQER